MGGSRSGRGSYCRPSREKYTHPGLGDSSLQSAVSSMEHLLGEQQEWRHGRITPDWSVQGWARGILRSGQLGGARDLRALHLDQYDLEGSALRAVFLRRWR